jgi:hypothetical protein
MRFERGGWAGWLVEWVGLGLLGCVNKGVTTVWLVWVPFLYFFFRFASLDVLEFVKSHGVVYS